MRIEKRILSAINKMVFKKSNYYFCLFLKNTYVEKYDLLNDGSSNLLKFINSFISTKKNRKITVILCIKDKERVNLYNEKINTAINNNISLKFVFIGHKKKIINEVKIHYYLFRSKYWLVETPGSLIKPSKKQKMICLNYFISCKNDLDKTNNYRWSIVDKYVTTNLLTSEIVSSQTGVKLQNCEMLGFPRNDTLIYSTKKKNVISWLNTKTNIEYKYIFVYAPTFRDYENNQIETRPLFGFECDDLFSFLEKNKILLIFKMHSWQNMKVYKNNSNIIYYENSYNYSFYDLLSITDCLIADYSSLIFDFLLLNRPIIYNLYDLELYKETRGLSFDPYENICAGPIVHEWNELKNEMMKVLEGKDEYINKRNNICKLIHKYNDFNFTERNVSFFDKYFNLV